MTPRFFRHGHASHSDWRAASELALTQALGAGEWRATDGCETLGFVYVTASFAGPIEAIVSELRARTGITHWVGTVGFGVLASGAEYMGESAIAIMLAEFPADSYRVFSGNQPLARALLGTERKPWRATHALVHADPSNAELPQMISELSDRLSAGYLFGGVASGDLDSPPQYADEVTHSGLSGVVFNHSVRVASRLSQGCTPLGAEHRISDCSGHYLQALDGEPALDVMLRDLGVAEELRGSRDGDALLRALPSQRLRRGLLIGLAPHSDEQTTRAAGGEAPRRAGFAEYQVRNLIGIDPENRLIAIAAQLTPGTRAVFCTRDQQSARNDLIRACTELRDEIESDALTVRGALYFSCVARGRNLFGSDGAEMEIIRHNLGEIPLIGIFANGEISRDRLYGYTGVLTLFV
jgi:small ligand-binding sensory domain FIST